MRPLDIEETRKTERMRGWEKIEKGRVREGDIERKREGWENCRVSERDWEGEGKEDRYKRDRERKWEGWYVMREKEIVCVRYKE